MRFPAAPLAIAAGIAACTAATPALSASLLTGGEITTMAANTDADGAVSWFDWRTSPTQLSNVISRDGRFAYVAASGTNGVLQYARDPSTGALTPLSPPVAAHPSGRQIRTLTLSPSGSRLFATADDSSLFSYPVGQDGLLGTRSADATLVAQAFRMTPDGRSAYSTLSMAGVSEIQMWDVAADGTFTAKSPASVVADGVLGSCLAISPGGTSLYVPTERIGTDGVPQVNKWSINPVTGLLTAAGNYGYPSVGYDRSCEAAVTPDGRLLVVAHQDKLRVWPIAADGSLGTQGTPLEWAAGGTRTSGLALHPSGIAAYATSAHTSDPAQPGTLAQIRLAPGGASLLPSAVSIPWVDVSWNDISAAPALPPIASVAEALGRPGKAVRLDASGSRDPDTAIARYDWEFGDGTSAADAGPRPEHVYARIGEYTARVTVTNTAGCSIEPVGLYNGRMSSCIGGLSATAAARVRVEAEPPAAPADGGTRGGGAGPKAKPRPLGAQFAIRGGIGRTTGAVPPGATRITQIARTGGSAATQGFLEMAKAKTAAGKCRIATVRNTKTRKVTTRTYRCTIRLSKGTWTVTTTARGQAGVVAEGTRRVVVR